MRINLSLEFIFFLRMKFEDEKLKTRIDSMTMGCKFTNQECKFTDLIFTDLTHHHRHHHIRALPG